MSMQEHGHEPRQLGPNLGLAYHQNVDLNGVEEYENAPLLPTLPVARQQPMVPVKLEDLPVGIFVKPEEGAAMDISDADQAPDLLSRRNLVDGFDPKRLAAMNAVAAATGAVPGTGPGANAAVAASTRMMENRASSLHHQDEVVGDDKMAFPNGFIKESMPMAAQKSHLMAYAPPFPTPFVAYPPAVPFHPNMIPFQMVGPPMHPGRLYPPKPPASVPSITATGANVQSGEHLPTSAHLPLQPQPIKATRATSPMFTPALAPNTATAPQGDDLKDAISRPYQALDNAVDAPDLPLLDVAGGVVFDASYEAYGGRWVVFWPHNNRIYRRSFLTCTYGYEGAKELAEMFWVQKMRAIQLSRKAAHEQWLLPASTKRKIEAQYLALSKARRNVIAESQRNEAIFETEVFWDEAEKSWGYQYYDKATDSLKVQHVPGGDDLQASKSKALSQLQAHWTEVIREYAESPYNGLTYEKTRSCWRVAHWIPSKRINRNRYFNVSKYGYKTAKENAIMYRKAVASLNGEEPENFVGLPIPSPQFFREPVVVFIHKILNSLKTTDVKLRMDRTVAPILPMMDNYG